MPMVISSSICSRVTKADRISMRVPSPCPVNCTRTVVVGMVRVGVPSWSAKPSVNSREVGGATDVTRHQPRIHVDVASGAKACRPKLDLVVQLMREGDTLQVTRLDRLSRSVLHLVTLGAELRERGIGLHR